MRNKFMTIIPFVLLFAMTCYGQGLYVTDLETTDDVTVGDDLTVTDDAAIGGDVTITGSLTAGSIVGSAATAFDDIGDPDGNGAVDFTDYYQTYDFGDTDHDMMTWWFTGAFGDVSGFVLEQKTGNPTNGTLFEMKLADTDVDFMSLYQGSEVLNIDSSGNITATGSITGDGGDEVVGFLKLVTNDTDDEVLTATDSGGVFTNAGDDGAQTFSLPAAAAGMEFTFVVMAAQELRIDPDAGDKIYYSATALDNGEYLTADAVGESIHLIAVDSANWIATSHIGTWKQETP
jgi:hypothetical protein